MNMKMNVCVCVCMYASQCPVKAVSVEEAYKIVQHTLLLLNLQRAFLSRSRSQLPELTDPKQVRYRLMSLNQFDNLVIQKTLSSHQCCSPRGKSLSLRILEDQFTSPCPCPCLWNLSSWQQYYTGYNKVCYRLYT